MPYAEFISSPKKKFNLEVLSRCEAVIVCHSLNDNIRKPFEDLFTLVKKDFDKPQHLRKGWVAIADTTFFFVLQEDMADFDKEFDYSKCYLPEKKVRTPLEKLFAHLEHWGGIKPDRALLHINPENMEDLIEVVKQLEEGIEEADKADQKY